jgi:hypothetical protein
MLVLIHISAALLSVLLATGAVIIPSRSILGATYGLTGVTFISGVVVTWQTRAPLMQTCTSGLVYLAVIAFLAILARRKLTG